MATTISIGNGIIQVNGRIAMRRFSNAGLCFLDEHCTMPALDWLSGVRERAADGKAVHVVGV